MEVLAGAGAAILVAMVVGLVILSVRLMSLVKVLSLRCMDLGENRQLEKVIESRRQPRRAALPDVFSEEEEQEQNQAPPAPKNLWQKVPFPSVSE